MTRINLFHKQDRNTPTSATGSASPVANSVSWGKTNAVKNVLDAGSPFIFAALLIACSLTVGCSSNKPEPVSSNHPSMNVSITPVTTPTQIATSTDAPVVPAQQTTQTAAAKPVHRKIVHKAPPTLGYTDKTTGVSFQYPRGYALKTGDAAAELLSTDPIPMDFTQPGGTTVATVTWPESMYAKSDLAAAYFDVSVNKTLTVDQCGEFSVPQANPASPGDPAVQATAQVAAPPISKLLIGDMELQSSEIKSADTKVAGDTEKSSRAETSKYYHVFQNGACYEFALKVATIGGDSTQAADETKRVNRDEVFRKLEKVLATVKIDPVTPEVNAQMKTDVKTDAEAKTDVVPVSPAQ
jgi:hypothetical protein